MQKREIDDTWTELLWGVAGQDKTNMDSLKATDVFEFFRILKAKEKWHKKSN